MTDGTLLLGPVLFQDFEIPCSISFGGAQRLAIHKLAGGGRVIDAMGRDDAVICFQGIFSGSDATSRARALDELRSSGLLLPLTWDVFFYTVVISQFQADYRNGWWIPYRITCAVLRDEASALIGAAVSLATSALADITAASAQGADLDLTDAQTMLAVPGATTRGSAAYAAAGGSLSSAQSDIASGIGGAEATMNGAAVSSAASADAGVNGLSTAVAAAQQLGSLTAAQGYIGRAAVNLENAST